MPRLVLPCSVRTFRDLNVSMRCQNPEFSKDLSGYCLPSVSQYLPLRGETDKYELIINSETKDIKKGG